MKSVDIDMTGLGSVGKMTDPTKKGSDYGSDSTNSNPNQRNQIEKKPILL